MAGCRDCEYVMSDAHSCTGRLIDPSRLIVTTIIVCCIVHTNHSIAGCTVQEVIQRIVQTGPETEARPIRARCAPWNATDRLCAFDQKEPSDEDRYSRQQPIRPHEAPGAAGGWSQHDRHRTVDGNGACPIPFSDRLHLPEGG